MYRGDSGCDRRDISDLRKNFLTIELPDKEFAEIAFSEAFYQVANWVNEVSVQQKDGWVTFWRSLLACALSVLPLSPFTTQCLLFTHHHSTSIYLGNSHMSCCPLFPVGTVDSKVQILFLHIFACSTTGMHAIITLQHS